MLGQYHNLYVSSSFFFFFFFFLLLSNILKTLTCFDFYGNCQIGIIVCRFLFSSQVFFFFFSFFYDITHINSY